MPNPSDDSSRDPSKKVTLEIEDRVALLKFNHPEVLNAVGSAMISDLGDALAEVKSQGTNVRALVLTGEGRAFCAGANLQETGSGKRREGAGDGLRARYHPLLLALRDLETPLVTAVNGAAAGVGMSFAAMGDIVCASEQAYFLQAFARIGLVPDGGSTFLLPRLIGWGRAVELSMLAERLPAAQAYDWGLVNRLYADNDALMEGAMAIASRLAAGPRSLGLIRRAYWSTWQNSYEQQLDLEAQCQNLAGASQDFSEGVSAFLEKRDAQFKGR